MSEKEQKQGWFKRNLSWIAVFGVIAFLSIIPFYVFKFLPYIAKRAEVRIDSGISANIASYGVVLAALASVFTAFILVLQWNEQRKQRKFIAQQTKILDTQQKVIEEQLEMQREERLDLAFSKAQEAILAINPKILDHPTIHMVQNCNYSSLIKAQRNEVVKPYERSFNQFLKNGESEAEKLFNRTVEFLNLLQNTNVDYDHKKNRLRMFVEDVMSPYVYSLFCYLCLKKTDDSNSIALFHEFSVFKRLKVTEDWKQYFIGEKGIPEDVINSLLGD
jgi:hypothetical protein